MTLAEQVEAFLRARGCWVSAAELCQKFGLAKRDLRGRDGKPGLCGDHVVSGNRGYLHISFVGQDAEKRAYRRGRRNAIAQMVRLRARHRAWLSYQAPQQQPAAERASGQLILLP
jgi:hypothetical protein